MKKNLTAIIILLLLGMSLFAGMSDIYQTRLCSSSLCEKVRSSSFGSVSGVSLGFWAAGLFGFILVLFMKNKTRPAVSLLASALGIEIYLSYIQIFYIHAVCFYCFSLLALLMIAWMLWLSKATLKPMIFTSVCCFFASHFIFFYPNVSLKPSFILTDSKERIEVFGSPSCLYCDEAVNDLKPICSQLNADLVYRPVCLSANDREKTLGWICRVLFSEQTSTSRRLAEQVVWENEKMLRKINKNISVPTILVSLNGKAPEVMRGWNEKSKEYLTGLFAKNTPLENSGPENMCSSGCKERILSGD